jgi:hypothetical protein
LKELDTVDGYKVMVDDDDYNYFKYCYELYIDKNGYVMTRMKWHRMGLPSGKLHVIITNPPKGKHIHVDHIDGNKLNNTKENLRICTHQENMRNRKVHRKYANKKKHSKYKGLTFISRDNVWQVRVQNKNVGYFNADYEIEAANCYNHFAKLEFGEFALLNNCPVLTYDEWFNKKNKKDKISKYRGVSKSYNKWIVQLMIKGKKIFLSGFDTEEDAAIAYNNLIIEYNLPISKLNKI